MGDYSPITCDHTPLTCEATPSSTITSQSSDHTPLTCEATPTTNGTQEDNVFLDDPLTTSIGGEGGGARIFPLNYTHLTTPAPDHIHLATPTPDHTHLATPTPDQGFDAGDSTGERHMFFPTESFEETDSAHGGCGYEPEVGVSESENDLDIADIAFSFKRRSLSFESLLDSFKTDHLFMPHASSLQSLGDVSDDESDQEGEGEGLHRDQGPHRDLDSSLLDNSLSVSDLDSSSLSCSFNNSELLDPLPDDGDLCDPLPDDSYLADPLPDGLAQSLGFDTHVPDVNESLTFETPHVQSADVYPLPDLEGSCPNTPLGLGNEQAERSEVVQPRVKLSHMKRSKSQDSTSRNATRKKNKPLRKTKQATPTDETTPTLASTPTDMLIQFQIASMGCVMGVESRVELRAVVKESETNSEKDNYSISQGRE